MGAATVLLAGGSEALPACARGIVEDCGYTSAADEFRYQARTLAHVPPWPLVPLSNRVCRRKAGYDYREADALAAVQHIRVPVLFIHGEEDTFVPTWMGRALYEACAAQKQLWLVPGARHAMSYAVAHGEYVRRVRAFLASLPWRGARRPQPCGRWGPCRCSAGPGRARAAHGARRPRKVNCRQQPRAA